MWDRQRRYLRQKNLLEYDRIRVKTDELCCVVVRKSFESSQGPELKIWRTLPASISGITISQHRTYI